MLPGRVFVGWVFLGGSFLGRVLAGWVFLGRSFLGRVFLGCSFLGGVFTGRMFALVFATRQDKRNNCDNQHQHKHFFQLVHLYDSPFVFVAGNLRNIEPAMQFPMFLPNSMSELLF